MTASLYLHIPFCASLCDYCDFYSIAVNETPYTLIDSFIDALLADIKDQFAFFHVDHVPSVYIGGGTPSALGAECTERLLSGLQALLKHTGKAPDEFTIEANPESADEDFLRACVKGGVSRISLGVQTFHEPSRRAVHRAGDGNLLDERLSLASSCFPDAFSVDLITGLPFQTAAVLREDIERILAFRPAHVSLYSLILEPETPLGKQAALSAAVGKAAGRAALALPRGDEADHLWITGRDMLEKAGLFQYEVSNFALPHKTCAHNIRYWRMENWLGAGPAASGTIIDDADGSGKRFSYPADINAYLAMPQPRIRSARIEELNQADLMRESLLMGFRYRAGPDPLMFRRRFGCSIEDCIPQTITRWLARGFFETAQNGNLTPSREGLLFLNAFLRDAFAELD
ncbi:MAG: radical SAM family heme chaperone HemW [Treponema sp.]|jgi:oxygen-independent coproporphyrinogen-3 oxidase|nr:radical SAM family heme chaperone HemW [Treponema sp.]